MDLSHIYGNEEIKARLQHMVRKKRVGHGLLFVGPDGIGKGLFAAALAKHLLGLDRNRSAHPDLHVYRPQGKIAMHSIDAMRRFADEVALPPHEAPCKVFVIHDAERMLQTSANALLKTFEEPTPRTVILLLASAPQKMLATVLSRCRALYFQPLSKAEIAKWLMQQKNVEEKKAHAIAACAHGSIARALHLLQEDQDVGKEILHTLLQAGRQMPYLEASQLLHKLAESLELLRAQLEKQYSEAFLQGSEQELTALQKAQLQKEVEGAASLRFQSEAAALFHECFAWFRDLHLLYVGADRELLHHRDQEHTLLNHLQRGALRPLAEVEQAVEQASLSLARSCSLRDVLESLFLRLGLL